MVKIVTDSTASLPPGISDQLDITIVPIYINFEDDSYRDGIDIDNETFIKRLKASETIPTTSAPPPKLFAESFERLSANGEAIICIHVSGQLSATFNSAVLAAQDFPTIDIRVFDSKITSGPLGTMVTLAAEGAKSGRDVDSISTELEMLIQRGRIHFMVDDLKFIAKSGRVNAAQALVGSLLQLKPILTFEEGLVVEFQRTRTYQRAIERLMNIVEENYPDDGSGYLSIMHADALSGAQQVAMDLKRRLHLTEVPIFDIPAGIVVHGGPGIIGVGFFERVKSQ